MKDRDKTPRTTRLTEDDMVQDVANAAVAWYDDETPPHHPSPTGPKWDRFIAKLAALARQRRG